MEEVCFGGRKGWCVVFLDLVTAILLAGRCPGSDDTVRADEEFDETDMSAKNKRRDGKDMYGHI